VSFQKKTASHLGRRWVNPRWLHWGDRYHPTVQIYRNDGLV